MIAFALHQKYLAAGGEGFLPMLANGNPNADAAFPTLVAKILPAGVKGLVVCGILAALMSSLASLFNSSAMLFTIDFWKRLKPNTSEKSLVRIGQTATVVIVILGILWIPIMRSVGDVLYTYLQDVQSVLAPGIAATFLLGILEACLCQGWYVGIALWYHHRSDPSGCQSILQQCHRRYRQLVQGCFLRLQLVVLLRCHADSMLSRCHHRITLH